MAKPKTSEQIAAEIAAFQANGGQVTEIPTGHSAYDLAAKDQPRGRKLRRQCWAVKAEKEEAGRVASREWKRRQAAKREVG